MKPYLKTKGHEYISRLEHLPSKLKTLGSVLSNNKKKENILIAYKLLDQNSLEIDERIRILNPLLYWSGRTAITDWET
jgi:hypothetical protein